MNWAQIYDAVNTATGVVTGQTNLLQEDMTNIVDVGVSVMNTGTDWHERYAKALVNQIGRIKVDDTTYRGVAPNIMRDGVEYGSILMQIRSDALPLATENPTWDLVGGQAYDPHVFVEAPAIKTDFWNKSTTWMVRNSIPDVQLDESFQNAQQKGSFVSMLFNLIDRSITVKQDAETFRLLGTAIASALGGTVPTTRVNLLADYNAETGGSLTVSSAMRSESFMRWAVMRMGIVRERMRALSRLYNQAGSLRFSYDPQVVYLSEFKEAMGVYLYSGLNQFNNDNLSLPAGTTVPYWQGLGTSPDFISTSTVNLKTPNPARTGADLTVNQSGVVAVMYDREAVCLFNERYQVTSEYNPVGRFTNYFYHQDVRYLLDPSKNFVVFYLGGEG